MFVSVIIVEAIAHGEFSCGTFEGNMINIVIILPSPHSPRSVKKLSEGGKGRRILNFCV